MTDAASEAGPRARWRAGAALDPLLVGTVALALRLLFFFLEYRGSPFYGFLHLDPRYYHDWGVRIASGEWLGAEVFEMSPLYPYLLALYFLVAGHDLTLLHLLQLLVGTATAVLTYLLGRRLFGRAAGLVAGLAAALYGPFLFYEAQVMKEFLTPFFSVSMLLLLYRGLDERPRRHVYLLLSGCCIGLAALVRDNFLLMLPLLALYLALRRTEAPAGKRLAEIGLVAAGTLLALTPAAAHNLAVSGEVVLTTSGGGEVFYIGNGPYANGAYVPPPWVRSNPRYEHEDFRRKARALTGRDLSRSEASRFWWRQGLRSILDDPVRWARLEIRKALLFINNHELPDNYSYDSFRAFSRLLKLLPTFGIVAALAAPGILVSASRWRELLPLYLAGGGYMASVLLFFNFARFRLPFMPVLFLFAGAGAVALWRAVASLRRGSEGRAPGRWRTLLVPAGAALLLLAVSHVDLHTNAEEPFQDRLHLGAAYRQAGALDQAESILRETIRDAEEVLRNRGWSPESGTVPGGITFALALHAAHRDLAGILLEQERTDEAIDQLLAAVPFDPNDAALFQILGGAYRAKGDLRAAAGAYGRGLAVAPGSFVMRFDLATVLHEAGDSAGALRELIRAHDLNRSLNRLDLADWHYGMGTVLLSYPDRREEALGHLGEGLRLNPSHPQAGAARRLLGASG